MGRSKGDKKNGDLGNTKGKGSALVDAEETIAVNSQANESP